MADPRIVEQDDGPMFRKAVGDRGIPVIHSTPKMLHENERYAARLTESAIGEADAVGLDELCRRGLVGMNHNGRSLIIQSAPLHRVRAPGLLSRNRHRSAPRGLRSPRSPRQFLRSP